MAGAYPEFRDLGVELVAVSVDDVSRAAKMAVATGAAFPVLADPTADTARDYGVYSLLGDGVAAPATFIVGKEGVILWRHVGENIGDRPPVAEILRQVREATG